MALDSIPADRTSSGCRSRLRGRAGPRRSSSGARCSSSSTGAPAAPAAPTRSCPGDGRAPRRRGARVDALVTADEEELAAAVRGAGDRRVVLVGGDGTVHALANLDLPALPPAALLPAGRANNIARALGIPVDWRAAAELAVRGRAAAVDVLEVVTPERRLFAVEGVSGGFHAAARHRYTGENSADLAAGARALVAELAAFRPHRVALRADGAPVFDGPAAQVFLSNLPLFGFGFEVNPLGDPADGRLEAIVLEARDATGRRAAAVSGPPRDAPRPRRRELVARDARAPRAADPARRRRPAARRHDRHRDGRARAACAWSPRGPGHERRRDRRRAAGAARARRRPVGLRHGGDRARRRPRGDDDLRAGPARADRGPARPDRRRHARQRGGRLRGPAGHRPLERPARHPWPVHPRRLGRRPREGSSRSRSARRAPTSSSRSRPPRCTSASTPRAPRTGRWSRSASARTGGLPPRAPRRARCSSARSPARWSAARSSTRRPRPLFVLWALLLPLLALPTLAWQRTSSPIRAAEPAAPQARP